MSTLSQRERQLVSIALKKAGVGGKVSISWDDIKDDPSYIVGTLQEELELLIDDYVGAEGDFLEKDQNLDDLNNKSLARSNLNVLKHGALDEEIRNNLELDQRYVPLTRTLQFTTDSALAVDDETPVSLAGDRIWGLSIEDHGDAQRGVLRPSAQDIYGNKTFIDDIFLTTKGGSTNYASGILGAGTRWDMNAAGGTFFEVDNMRVRNELRTHIFKKDIVKASNGYLFITDAAEIGISTQIYSSAEYFQDYFLPSKDELHLIWENIASKGMGGFDGVYWSSSESSSTKAWSENMETGSVFSHLSKDELRNFRAVRTFTLTESSPSYDITSFGPAKGLIFHIVDNEDGTFTYYEVSLIDDESIWSNISDQTVGTNTAVGTGQANTSAIINQTGHTASAALLCDQISENKNLLIIEDSGTNAAFNQGDLLWAKNIQDDGSLDVTGVKITCGEQLRTGTIGDKSYIVYDIDAVENGGTLNAGDTIVRVSGGTILNDASSQYSPFIDIYDGVTSWADFQSLDKLKARYGNLEGITDDDFGGALSGYGLYSDNVYLKGKMVINGGSDLSAVESVFPTDENLELYYSYNETGDVIHDNYINEINGTLGSGASRVAGINKSSRYFDGSTSANLGLTFSEEMRGYEFSISTWVIIESTTADICLFSHGYISDQAMWYEGGSERWRFSYRDTGGTIRNMYINNEPPLNEWIHLVLTVEWTTQVEFKLYINGEYIAMDSRTEQPRSQSGSTNGYIAAYGGGANDNWRGNIDEFRYYSKILSDIEIKGLYKYITKSEAAETFKMKDDLVDMFTEALYGETLIVGGYVKTDLLTADNIITGRLQSADNTTYFDLDNNEIGGKITFRSGKTDVDVENWIGDAEDKADAALLEAYANFPYDGGDLEIYFSLDEGSGTTINDGSPNERDGTLTSGVDWSSEAVAGGNAIRTYLSGPHYGSHPEITFNDYEPNSCSVWIKYNGTPSNLVIPFGQIGSSRSIYLSNASGEAQFIYRTTTNYTVVSTANMPDLYDGLYHHLCWTVDDARKVSVYVDGVFIDSTTLGGSSYFIYEGIGLGHGSAYVWDGWIDEYRIYSRELTIEEIKGLYKIKALGEAEAVQTVIDGGLVTTGRIVLANAAEVERAGITGGGSTTNIAIWAGATYDNRSNADFKVDYNGKLFATGAEISGKITADDGEIAGWDILSTEISKIVGDEKAVLSSDEMQLYFSKDGKKRTVLRSDEIEVLSDMITASSPETETYTLDESWAGDAGSTFDELTPSFTVSIGGVAECTFRTQYILNSIATIIDAGISGTAYLCDSGGATLQTLGTFDVSTDNNLGFLEVFTFTAPELITSGTYRLRFSGTYYDFSTDEDFFDRPGTFEIGGGNNDQREFNVVPDSVMKTEFGNNGMYSFWGRNKYFYIDSKDNISLKSRGRTEFKTYNDTASLYVWTNDIVIDIYSGGALRMLGLPTSASGESGGTVYVDSNGFLKLVGS